MRDRISSSREDVEFARLVTVTYPISELEKSLDLDPAVLGGRRVDPTGGEAVFASMP